MKQTVTLVIVLLAAVAGWALLARVAGGDGPPDYAQAMTWARELLGLAGTLGGFLGISAASLTWGKASAEGYAAAGVGGILAGATLLEIGGWPIPAALASMVIGATTIRVIQGWREQSGTQGGG